MPLKVTTYPYFGIHVSDNDYTYTLQIGQTHECCRTPIVSVRYNRALDFKNSQVIYYSNSLKEYSPYETLDLTKTAVGIIGYCVLLLLSHACIQT